MTREDKIHIYQLIRAKYSPGESFTAIAAENLLRQGNLSPQALGFSRMKDLLGEMSGLVHMNSHGILSTFTLCDQSQPAEEPEEPSEPEPKEERQPAPKSAAAEDSPTPPPCWQDQIYFPLKTQTFLCDDLKVTSLTGDYFRRIAADYDRALSEGKVLWIPQKGSFTVPLSMTTPTGEEIFLAIKPNDYAPVPPWRVSFVGLRYPRNKISQPTAPQPVEPSPQKAPQPEVMVTYSRLSDRDKQEIYDTLLHLYPVGTPILLSVAGAALSSHGLTHRRYGYSRSLQMFSDMPEYFQVTSEQPLNAPPIYSVVLLPQNEEESSSVTEAEHSDEPPFAMTERTISFPLSQQGILARFINGPEESADGDKLSEEQLVEVQNSYDDAVSQGQLTYDSQHLCYRFPLSLLAKDGCALAATIRRSDRPNPPAWYVSFLEKTTQRGVPPAGKLLEFAYLGQIPDFLEELACKAEHEVWNFSHQDGDYSILWNYISYTFYRLEYEDKIYIDPDGQFAAFNTGLLSRRFGEDLYAYFEPNSMDQPRWKFVCFCSGTNEAASPAEKKAVARLLPVTLELPCYFNNLYDTMFDPNSKLESNFIHIVRDNLSRFPLDWLHRQCDDYKRTRDILCEIESVQPDQQKELFVRLGEAITDETDDEMCGLLMDMKDLFEGAVRRTLDQCRRNFKLAIPCYFPSRNVMSMLLPISFSRAKNGAPSLVLVAERQKNGIYLGRTVLTLPMAYIDARLLCRPSSEWLNTAHISEILPSEESLDN